MSQENVEIARKSLEAFRRGEFDLATEPWDPAGEWIPAMAGAVEDKVYRGHADLRRYFEELFEASRMRPDDMEFRDLGNRVARALHARVRGRDSGVAINQPGGIVYGCAAGRSSRAEEPSGFPDEAFEAAGLSEQDAHADS